MNICDEIKSHCVEMFITIVICLCFMILFVTTCTISVCEMFGKNKNKKKKNIFFIGETDPPKYEDIV